MQKAIELANKIRKDIEADYRSSLEDINFHTVFEEIYRLPNSIVHINTIIAFIIFAYDNDSRYINIKSDREVNKIEILEGLNADSQEEIYQSLLSLETDDFQEVVWKFLKRQPDWRFRTIITCFDFHSKHIRSATEPISAAIIDDLEIAKINKAKGELLKEAIRQREVGESLLLQIRKDYVNLDTITQSEFAFNSTDVEKVDILSWRGWIKERNKRKQEAIQT